MLTLMVRHKVIGFRWYQAANLESLLQRIQWEREQPGLAYMKEDLAIVIAIVAHRPQGYMEGHGYNIGIKEYDIHLDTGTGEYWEGYRQGKEQQPPPSGDFPKEYIPKTGLYHGKTLYGEPIPNCQNIATLEECERILREYQLTVHNGMLGIDHEKVVRAHLKTVDPYYEKKHEESTHPGRGDAEVHPVTPSPDSTGLRNDSTQDSGAMCATGPEPGSETPPNQDGGRAEELGDGGGRGAPAGAD